VETAWWDTWGNGRTTRQHAAQIDVIHSFEVRVGLGLIKIMHSTGRWSAARVMPAYYNAKFRPSSFRHCNVKEHSAFGEPLDVVSILVLVLYFCEFLSLLLAHVGFYRIIFMDACFPSLHFSQMSVTVWLV